MRVLKVALAMAVASMFVAVGSALAKSRVVHLTVNGTGEQVSQGRKAKFKPNVVIESKAGSVVCSGESGNFFEVEDFSNNVPTAQLEVLTAALPFCTNKMPQGTSVSVHMATSGNLALLAVKANGKATFLFHGAAPVLDLFFPNTGIKCDYALKTMTGTVVTEGISFFFLDLKVKKLKLIKSESSPACESSVTLNIESGHFEDVKAHASWVMQTLP